MTHTSTVNRESSTSYRYRPVLFFFLAYLFTWIFWIPAIFTSENLSAGLMVIGLIAPAAVSTCPASSSILSAQYWMALQPVAWLHTRTATASANGTT